MAAMNGFPVVAGMGAQTAVGLDLPANVAAVRAGLNCFKLSDYLLGYKNGEPLKVSQLANLGEDITLFERMKSMALAAAREALKPWLESFARDEPLSLAVLLAVPATKPGIDATIGKNLLAAILGDLRITPVKDRCGLASTGHEGGLAALGYAANLIRTGGLEAVLVGGVECYHEIDTLHWLESQDRLKVEE